MSVQRGPMAIDPERSEAERFGADGIPGIRRHKGDPNRQELQVIERQMINPGAGFVNSGGVDGKDHIEMTCDAGGGRQRRESRARAVCKDRSRAKSPARDRSSAAWLHCPS